MKLITCVGYHATGAGVIDDLLRECDNVAQGKYEREVRFLHDPDGVADLEYHLVTNPHRSASGQAIKRFIHYTQTEGKQGLSVFGPRWNELAIEYAESLAIMKYKGWRFADVEQLPFWEKSFFMLRRAFNHLLPRAIRKPGWYDYFPKLETYYSLLSRDVFLEKTRSFVAELCESANPEHKEYLMLDQFVPSHNPLQSVPYIGDIKIIIVDRDPRDLYIHNMYHKDHRLPKDPHLFATQYRLMRKRYGEEDSRMVLRVNFEDMIYNYQDYTTKVFRFLGINPIEHHVQPKAYFNPDVSIKGTQMWKRFPQYLDSVAIIEKELPDMLYSYPK